MRSILLAVAGAAVIALAGCGTAHVPVVSRPVAKNTPAGTGQATATSTAGPTPKQRAETDATSILASFVVPPGAVKLPSAPSVGNGVLKRPDGFLDTPDLVDDAAWWEAPGVPQVLLAWEKSRLPRQFWDTGYASGTGNAGGVYYWSDNFQLPAVAGVLNSRTLAVEAVDVGGGKTDFRVDAQVAWIPARPASEAVPSAARAVTLSALPDPNVHAKPPAPVTITNPDQVRALAALIDGLPEFPPDAYSCPADPGDSLALTFRARPGGPALAVATVETSACEGVDFTVGGKQQPGLGGPFEGRSTAAQALKIAGLHWQLYNP
jgi:hypothetical protein